MKSYIVSAHGGQLDYVRDGEVLLSVAVPPGRVRAAPYFDLAPEGAEIHPGKDLKLVEPRSAYGVQDYGPGRYETGANPDFQPTSADRMQRQLRHLVAQMAATSKRLDAREAALASIERIPNAPEPAPAAEDEPPVVE